MHRVSCARDSHPAIIHASEYRKYRSIGSVVQSPIIITLANTNPTPSDMSEMSAFTTPYRAPYGIHITMSPSTVTRCPSILPSFPPNQDQNTFNSTHTSEYPYLVQYFHYFPPTNPPSPFLPGRLSSPGQRIAASPPGHSVTSPTPFPPPTHQNHPQPTRRSSPPLTKPTRDTSLHAFIPFLSALCFLRGGGKRRRRVVLLAAWFEMRVSVQDVKRGVVCSGEADGGEAGTGGAT